MQLAATVDFNQNTLNNVGNANSTWADGSMVVAGTTNSILDIRKEDAGTGNLRFLNGSTEEFRIWLDTSEARLGISTDGGTTNALAILETNGNVGIGIDLSLIHI